jgi:hypothetical protein
MLSAGKILRSLGFRIGQARTGGRTIWIACTAILCARLAIASFAAELSYAPAPADNPLKGFVPYDGLNTNFPHSLEFFYLPLGAVQTGYTDFDWAPLERKLGAIAQRGHQAVLRFYLDYPNLPSGLPSFLTGIPVREYNDHGNGTRARSVSPDYENPDLRRAMTNFVAAFGARYDSDPRVGFITAGLLGFWGEWHTYPHNGFQRPANWFASFQVQREVLDAYAAAFRITPVLLREPKPGVSITTRRLGYHDDSFAFSTLGPEAWHFWPVVKSYGLANIWRTQPIGGEIRPELWDCLWSEPSCAPAGQEFLRCVETTHASWLLDSGTFKGIAGANRERALAGARRLGYELFVSSVEFAAEGGGKLHVSVAITNTGVAPFYYRWPIRLAVLDAGGGLRQFTNDWDLTAVQPGAAATRFAADLIDIPSGRLAVLMAALNPLPNGHPIRFANQTQDLHHPGWLTLGEVDVPAAPRLRKPAAGQGYFEMEIQELAVGAAAEVQHAPTPGQGGWTTVDSFTPVTPTYLWRDSGVGATSRLFRVIQLP